MAETYTYFAAPLKDVDALKKILEQKNFSKNKLGEYEGRAGRIIRVNESMIEIGIPTTDLLDELEQLEFVVSVLGLDIDDFQKVV